MLKQVFLLALIWLLVACSPTTSTEDANDISDNSGSELNLTSIPVTIAPTTENNSDPIPTREGVTTDVSSDSGSGFGLDDAVPQGSGFTAEIDGAETLTVSGIGVINCENNVYVIRASLDSFPQISLILPGNASPGNFTLVNNPGDGSAASATVFFEDGRVFATAIDGILIINALATEPGQAVSGNFDFSARSSSQTINASGEFEFVSGEDAVYCP